MINLIKIMVSIVIIVIASVLQNFINGKKQYRIMQFPLIGISIVFMTISAFLCAWSLDTFNFLDTTNSFLLNVDILAINIILIFLYALVKVFFKSVIFSINKKKNIIKLFALSFYDYDEEYEGWFLNKRWTGFRQYLLSILCGMNLVIGAYLGLTWVSGSEGSMWVITFPCIILVVLNEFYGYINGQTKEEYRKTFLADDSKSQRVSNYFKIREVLEQMLPEPLLSAHTGCEFIRKETSSNIIDSLKASDSFEDRIIADFFETEGRYKNSDADCLQATVNMIYRKNVVFFNPFYRDLGLYILFPLIRTLLSGKKSLVLCGRNSICDDVKRWLSELLNDYSHLNSLWRVNNLLDKKTDCEVGVLTFSQIYEKNVINANSDFFSKTDFVLLIEPSIILNTSQIALSIIAEKMTVNDKKPVYCIIDRFVDGLIDTVSHLIYSEITDVVATPVPRCEYTAISWDANGDFNRQYLFDKQTRYFGNGVELAAIAVKNQIPAVTWYGEKKIPLKDIKWIAGQYYSTICRYMNQPCQQNKLYEKIKFVSNLWSTERTKEQFIIVEDEFCNMFSIMSSYLSRGESQVFVNILSENYLLRDYMRCNKQMFISNPNSVPAYVAEYAKTERNTILKLIIAMLFKPMDEKEVLKELQLAGIGNTDVYGTLINLIHKYTFADDSLLLVKNIRKNISEFTSVATNLFSVSESEFDKYFSNSLKNAYFILEDEESEQGYLDSKLFSHVTQIILPGQLITYDGKYYQVKYVSPKNGVVLRRAADLFDGRKYYRQVRTYKFDSIKDSEIISTKKIMDIEFFEINTDFNVTTTGYLEMDDYHNLRTARLIDFSLDPNMSTYTRTYRNKTILKINFPESDSKLCFTFSLLLSEIFKSVFPDCWQYLAVLTKTSEDIKGMLNYAVYSAIGDIEEGYIYIVEDSDLDLGLLDAVERHFAKFMEIIADFLDWHFEKMRESAPNDPIPVKIQIKDAEEKGRRTLVLRMFDRIRKLFSTKKEDKVNVNSIEEVESDAEQDIRKNQKNLSNQTELAKDETKNDIKQSGVKTRDVLREITKTKKCKFSQDNVQDYNRKNDALEEQLNGVYKEDQLEEMIDDDPDLIHIDGTDIFDNDGLPEDNDYFDLAFKEMGLEPTIKTRYQKECYLKFGFEEIDSRIQVEELRRYLRVRGWCNNSLTQARKSKLLKKNLLDTNVENHCDFCSLPLNGVSYELLNDGRIRCNDCSNSAITTLKDFKELFYQCLNMIEGFFGIQYRVPINIKMTNAHEIAKESGIIFKPSTEVSTRTLGFAQKKKGKYNLVIENGSPRLAAIDTIVHEMTHIWQYINWNDKEIVRIYSMSTIQDTNKAKDIVYEGMAMWVAIQFLYQIGETYYAAQQEALADARKDVYGIGFRLYKNRYPFVKDLSLLKYTPFSEFPTLEPSIVKNSV